MAKVSNCGQAASASEVTQLNSSFLSAPQQIVRSNGSFMSWKWVALFVLVIVVNAEAQTFQYSRGWTNGKRSGVPILAGSDAETQYYSGMDPSDIIIPPGHLQMSLGPQQARFHSMDYNQYLVKRAAAGAGGGSVAAGRKQPMWFGTILGVDGSESTNSKAGATPEF